MDNQNNYEFEKYVCMKETLKQTIENYGVAIIPYVLDENEYQNEARLKEQFFYNGKYIDVVIHSKFKK